MLVVSGVSHYAKHKPRLKMEENDAEEEDYNEVEEKESEILISIMTHGSRGLLLVACSL